MDLFFVLSGFLVSGLLFREYRKYGRVYIARFLARRGLKIYPAFYVFLLLSLVIRFRNVPIREWPATSIAAEAIFIQNYFSGLTVHTWSLAVEEHFYLLCAALFFVLVSRARDKQDPFRAIPYMFVGVAILALSARIANAIARPYSPSLHIYPTHLRIDGLLFGVALAYLHHFRRADMDRWLSGKEVGFGFLGAALLVPAFVVPCDSSPAIYTFGLSAFYVGSGLLVLASVRRGLPCRPVIGVLALVGSYSYSIYLWHAIVMGVVQKRLGAANVRSWWIVVPVILVSTLAVGIVMAKIVEIPVLSLRDRLFPSTLNPTGNPDLLPGSEVNGTQTVEPGEA